MGRPLNKRFFGDGAGLIACSADVDGTGAEACFITEQRSNSKYRVQTEAAFASNALVIGTIYKIVTVGTGTWADAGASSEAIGTVFTATATTNGQADGTADAQRVCLIVDTAPAAGEMRVDVQAENAIAPDKPTFTFSTNGTGNVTAVTLLTGGYGYWTNGAAFTITVASDAGFAGVASIVTLTVANGVVTSAGFTAGSGYSNNIVSDPIVAGDVLAFDANPPLQYARIINARQVKTFEGNTFDWPIIAPLGAGPTGMTQANLGSQ